MTTRYNLISDQSIRAFIYDAYGIDVGATRFPGAMPSTLMRADLPKLCGHTSPYIQYVVSPKIDGERALIAVLQNGSVFAVDRAMKITELFGVTLPPATLLDVERADGVVWVFDAMMVNGRSLRTMPYHHRMQLAGADLKSADMLRMKPFYTDRIPELESLGGRVDGLVFTPVTKAVTPFRNTDMFKWKPTEHQTVDLRWKQDGTLAAVDEQRKEVIIVAGMMPGDGAIWECINSGGWIPTKIRRDRSEPNALFVVHAVSNCIRENISLAELHTLFNTAN